MVGVQLLASVSAVALLFAGPALAQSAPAPSASAQTQPGASSDAASPRTAPQTLPASSSAPATTLSEVVITAQARGENLQKAAVAVDVVKGSELTASGVTNIDTLSKLVPALTVEGTSNGSLIFIRGVGNFTFQPSSDPASAFNYDGVYIGRPTSNAGVFYDLQRIEVLKGPQGTLYGRNATAGAINVLPVQPVLGSFSGYATTTYGNYETSTTEGAVNIPVGDNGAVRISGSYDRHDAYFIGGTGTDDSGGTRFQVKYKFTPALTARFSFDYAHEGGTGPGNSFLGSFVLNPATQKYVFTSANIPRSNDIFSAPSEAFIQTITAGTAGRKFGRLVDRPFEDNDFYGTHLQVDWDTPVGTVSVLPAYRVSSKNNRSNLSLIVGDDQTAQQFSVETRLVSHPGHLFDYIIGFYYFDEVIKDVQSANVQSISSFTNSRYNTTSPAGYGRLTWHVTDRLRLTGGVRYTSDDKSFSSASQTLALVCALPTGCPAGPLLPYTATLAQQPFVPAASGGRVLAGGGALVARVDSAAAAKESADKPTYRAAVEFDLAPRSLAYASVETGYRSGGFNTAAGFNTFNPETITAYTVGLKNRLFDNRVQLNLEGFDWEYHNQQLSALGVDATGRSTVITQNIGRSTIRGVEAEGQFLITSRTVISADVQYLDATYNSFTYQALVSSGVPFTGCAVRIDAAVATRYDVDCSGKPVFNAPHWTINAGIQHTIPVAGYDVVFSANSQYRSRRFTSFDYIPQELVGDTIQTDAQISFSPSGGRWSFSAYVHNLENERIQVYASPGIAANLVAATYNQPRTYGVRLSSKF